jgi:serine/threonine protein kinase
VRQNPAVLGRRLFNTICQPDAFVKSVEERFAHGVSGDLYLGHPIDDPTKQVAIKEIDLYDTDDFGSTEEGIAGRLVIGNFFREILCLLVSEHPTILKLVGWNITIDDGGCHFRHVTAYVPEHLMSLDDQGERSDRMRTNLSATMKLNLAYGAAVGMKHLHDFGIIHRDLKPGNILFDGNGWVVIAGLDLSKAARTGGKQSNTNGTLAYTAPEFGCGDRRYSFPADVYSFGVCIWEMMSGQSRVDFVCGNWTINEFRDAMKAGDTHPNLDFCRTTRPKLCELLEKCFEAPEKRPSFGQIIQNIEANPSMFDGVGQSVDVDEFVKYQRYLESAKSTSRDDDLMYLLRGLRAMDQVSTDIRDLPDGSPLVEKILVCLGRMFGPGDATDVQSVARDQFASRGCLDGTAFLRALEGLQ